MEERRTRVEVVSFNFNADTAWSILRDYLHIARNFDNVRLRLNFGDWSEHKVFVDIFCLPFFSKLLD
ncbi:hypothetical protein NDU88_005590 [Pleurodeles waltl]|uniref:Uncharacterized protein n=1 Tax=Pleurodeles waltl TaxID=8319 RepID=A0AAV7MJU4_PLEWA|nr:hypothetical protein NDU88_005590 [Pleurodeles waltl]